MDQFLYWLQRRDGNMTVNIARAKRALTNILQQDDAVAQLSKPNVAGFTALHYAVEIDEEIAERLIMAGVPVDVHSFLSPNEYSSGQDYPGSMLTEILSGNKARIMRSIIKRGIVFDPPTPLPLPWRKRDYNRAETIFDYYVEEYRVYLFLASLSQLSVTRSPLHDYHLWRTVAKYCCVPHRAAQVVI